MKVKSFLLGLLAMTAVVACQEDQLQETPKLDLGSESVTVPAEGQDVTFTVTSNVAWTATSDKEWATVSPSSGDGSDSAVTVTVEVAANDEEAARTAVITVAAGDLTKTFTISQSAMEAVAGDTWYVAGGFNEWNTTASPMTLEGDWYVLTDVAVDAGGFKFLKNSSWDVNLTADATVVPNVKYAALDGQGRGNTYVEPLGTYDLYLSKTLDSLCVMTPGLKPGEVPALSEAKVDGKQWTCTWIQGVPAVFDFGVTAEGMFYFAYYMQEDVWAPMYQGEYIIEETDATTGIVHLNLHDPYSGGTLQVNMPYSELTSTSVTFDPTELEAQLYFTDPFVCTAAEDLITISVGGQGGEAGLDGYQWIAPNPNGDGTYLLLDFSASDAGIMYVATGDGENFTATKVAEYAVEPLDETSGIIYFVEFDPVTYEDIGEEQEWAYEALEDGSVTITLTEIGKVTFDVTEDYYPITIVSDATPSGKIENGQYWFLEGTKFAEPYAGDKTYGYLPASEGVDNGGALATLASNAFTFTYVAEYGGYTIQDCNGRYLGAGVSADGWTLFNTFNFATSLPTDDTIGYYIWVVADPSLGDYNEGEFDIYNKSTWWSISYDSSKGWGSFNPDTASSGEPFPGYPTLVKADDPVESLPEPAGPVEATIAEFLAAAESSEVWYQLTGTIISIDNTTYGNITIKDETGEVYVYGLTAAQVSSNDKSFSTLGLGVNDVVTLIGTRAAYNSTPQVGGPAYYVSHVDNPDPVGPALPEDVESIEVDFSTVTDSVQYAEESHTFGALTLNIVSCHINAQLRIYSSASNNGVVVSNALPGNIYSIDINAGNKPDNLIVYGSNDGGATWNEVSKVAVAAAYKDYTVSFDGLNYNMFKFDVEGTQQVRISKMTVNYYAATK